MKATKTVTSIPFFQLSYTPISPALRLIFSCILNHCILFGTCYSLIYSFFISFRYLLFSSLLHTLCLSGNWSNTQIITVFRITQDNHMNFINVDNFYFLQLRRTGVFHSLVVKDGLFYLSDVYMDEIRIKITCSNIPKSRETLVNQGFSAHKKITVPTAPMSVKTVIASARSGVRTLDTLIKSQVLYQLS